MLGVVEMAEHDLVGEGEGAAEPPAHDGEVLLHRGIHGGGHFGGRFERYHLMVSSRVLRQRGL
jgi:hypothetical protein